MAKFIQIIFTLLIILNSVKCDSIISPSLNIIDTQNYLTTPQHKILSQHLNNIHPKSNTHLKIIIIGRFNNQNEVRKHAKKLAENTWDLNTKDIILISYISNQTRLLTTYLGEKIHTEFTDYTSNDILDRAMRYDGGNFSDFLTMIYLLIVQSDNTSFSTKKTHFDKLEHATLKYK